MGFNHFTRSAVPFDFHSCVHGAANIVITPVVMYGHRRGEFQARGFVSDVVVGFLESRTS